MTGVIGCIYPGGKELFQFFFGVSDHGCVMFVFPEATPQIMTENVILAVEFAIIPGRFEDFKTLAAEMIEAAQHNEPGTLNYEWAISDDRQVCHVYERFRDSVAVMTHMEHFNANFAARFSETVKLARFVVYGTPSAQVKDALAGASPVYMAPFGGLSR